MTNKAKVAIFLTSMIFSLNLQASIYEEMPEGKCHIRSLTSDIVFEIVERFDIKSLMNLKRSSQYFYSLIKSDNFLAKVKSKNLNTLKGAIYCYGQIDLKYAFLVDKWFSDIDPLYMGSILEQNRIKLININEIVSPQCCFDYRMPAINSLLLSTLPFTEDSEFSIVPVFLHADKSEIISILGSFESLDVYHNSLDIFYHISIMGSKKRAVFVNLFNGGHYPSTKSSYDRNERFYEFINTSNHLSLPHLLEIENWSKIDKIKEFCHGKNLLYKHNHNNINYVRRMLLISSDIAGHYNHYNLNTLLEVDVDKLESIYKTLSFYTKKFDRDVSFQWFQDKLLPYCIHSKRIEKIIYDLENMPDLGKDDFYHLFEVTHDELDKNFLIGEEFKCSYNDIHSLTQELLGYVNDPNDYIGHLFNLRANDLYLMKEIFSWHFFNYRLKMDSYYLPPHKLKTFDFQHSKDIIDYMENKPELGRDNFYRFLKMSKDKFKSLK